MSNNWWSHWHSQMLSVEVPSLQIVLKWPIPCPLCRKVLTIFSVISWNRDKPQEQWRAEVICDKEPKGRRHPLASCLISMVVLFYCIISSMAWETNNVTHLKWLSWSWNALFCQHLKGRPSEKPLWRRGSFLISKKGALGMEIAKETTSCGF